MVIWKLKIRDRFNIQRWLKGLGEGNEEECMDVGVGGWVVGWGVGGDECGEN